MHIRQISLASLGFIISVFLIFSGITLSISRVNSITFGGPPTAHATSEIFEVALVVAAVVVTGGALGIEFAGTGMFGAITGGAGLVGGEIGLSIVAEFGVAGLAFANSIVEGVILCAAGLTCGNDGGSDNGTYSVAAGAVSGDECYGPLNSCGKAYKGTYKNDSATGQMGCEIGGKFDYGAPADSTCTGPSIDYFRIKNDAGAGTVDSGQSVTLEWSSPGASYCKWSGKEKNFKAEPKGELTLPNITQTSSFQITCADASDNYGLSKFVTVTVLEPEVTLSVDRNRVRAGDSVTAIWNAKDIQSCVVTNLAGTVLASGAGEKRQFSTGSPYSTKINVQNVFKIVCQTLGDPITKQILVNVVPNYGEF